MITSGRRCWSKFGIIALGLFVCLTVLAALPVFAQLPTATILGTVKDTTGAVVPQATVTAKNLDTGATRTVTTEGDGSYRLSALPVGNYEVDIEHAGFAKESRTGLTLTVAQEAVVNVTLNVGQTQQTVQVTEEAPQVDTTSSTLGGTVTEQKLEELPLNGRNFLDLASLQPGVSSVGSTEGQVRGLGGDVFVFNGATMRSNNYMLDGAILQNAYGMNSQSVAKTSLGLDGIKEFKTITDLFSAEYGLTMGGQITMVSKGGTNNFHGDAFEYVRNNAFDSKNFFDSGPIPRFRRNQFGGAFGGPIKKDKVFFWGVYEGLRELLGLTELDTVLPAGCHGPAGTVLWNGDTSLGPRPAGSQECDQLGIGPFYTGPSTPTSPNSVTISPITAPLLAVIPLPGPTPLLTANNQFTFPASKNTGVNYGQMRVDVNFSDKDQFFGRYTVDQAASVNPNTYPTVHDTVTSLSQFITIAETHIFSPTVVNTARASYSRTGFISASLSTLTIPFVKGMPTGGFSAANSSFTGYGPQPIHGIIKQNILSWSDDVNWNKGRHAFKFGTLINDYGQALDQGFFSYGTIGFGTLSNFDQALYTSTSFTPSAANENRYYRYWTLGFYAQDDVRVTSRLTGNFGLRYEFNTQPIEMNGKQAAFRNPTDPTTTPGPVVSNPSLKSFSPRVGFAWDIFGNGKTALRGGAGIFYDIANIGSALQQDASGTPPISYQGGNGPFLPNAAQPLILPIDLPPNPVIMCPPCTNQGVVLSTTTYFIQQPSNTQWSLTLERQLPFEMALGVSYVGSRGIHLWSDPEGNYAIPTAYVNGQKFWDPTLTPCTAPLIPTGCYGRLNPLYNDNSLFTTRGDSWYNALEVELTKRVSHGLTFQDSYTFSKLIDTPTGQTANQDAQTANSSDPINPFTDKGPSELDLTHQNKLNVLYHVPNLVKSNGFLSKVTGGWWTGSIVTIQSGFAFSPTLGYDVENSLNNQSERPDIVTAANVAAVRAGTYMRDGVLGGMNPNAVPYNPNTVITGNLTPVYNSTTNSFTTFGWYNPNMFIPGPPGFVGDASRGMLRGPGFATWDFSLVKDTKIGESKNLQFRAEFFNFLNHPNFGLPDNQVYGNGPAFNLSPGNPPHGTGAVTCTATTVVCGPTQFNQTSGLIQSTGVLTPRQIQFSLRLEF